MTLLTTSVPANFSPIHADQNNTNGTSCSGKTEDWVYPVMQVYILLIAVLGIVFNVFVLMVFCLHKRACTVPEIYLSNLAAADLLLVSCLPFWAVYVGNKFDWPFGSFLCKLVPLSITMNAYCSIYFLVLVSLDRYMALVHPLTLERLRRPKYAKLSCVVVWAVGLLLNVPVLIFREVKYSSETNTTSCYLNYPMTHVVLFDTMMIIFSFIIPISIISYCTLKIIQALNNRVKQVINTENTEQKATTLVLAVLFAFLICWIPFHILKIIELLVRLKVLEECSLETALHYCQQIFMYVAFFNSVLNPILYVIVGKQFQEKVKKLFKKSTNKSLKRTISSNVNSVYSQG